MDYKKIVFSVILSVCFGAAVWADETQISNEYIEKGNSLYQQYFADKKTETLEEAYLNYYKASEVLPTSSSYLGMGMVMLEKKMHSKAKSLLYKAYSIDEADPTTNYYLGKMAYDNQEYRRALSFFNVAYSNGLMYNMDVNLMIASIYAKLGDLTKSRLFYENVLRIYPTSQDAKLGIEAISRLEINKDKYGQ